MAKRSAKQVPDPNDLEIHPTVAGFEVALRKLATLQGKPWFEVVLRSTDRKASEQIFLTDRKPLATRQLMAFHAGACAMQRLTGAKLERRAA